MFYIFLLSIPFSHFTPNSTKCSGAIFLPFWLKKCTKKRNYLCSSLLEMFSINVCRCLSPIALKFSCPYIGLVAERGWCVVFDGYYFPSGVPLVPYGREPLFARQKSIKLIFALAPCRFTPFGCEPTASLGKN